MLETRNEWANLEFEAKFFLMRHLWQRFFWETCSVASKQVFLKKKQIN